MSVRNLTVMQIIICLCLVDLVILSYELGGEMPASAMLALSSIVNFLMGREPPAPPPSIELPREPPSRRELERRVAMGTFYGENLSWARA